MLETQHAITYAGDSIPFHLSIFQQEVYRKLPFTQMA